MKRLSTTTLTPPPLLPYGIHFGLNLLQGHRFVGHGMQLFQHLAEFPPRTLAPQLVSQPISEPGRFQQSRRTRLIDEGVGQIELNRDTHAADKMPATTASYQIGAERGCVRSITRSTSADRGALATFERVLRGEAAAAGPLDTAALRSRKEARA